MSRASHKRKHRKHKWKKHLESQRKKWKEDNRNEITNRNSNNDVRDNKNKTNVYIYGDRMVKKLNDYLLTKKINISLQSIHVQRRKSVA